MLQHVKRGSAMESGDHFKNGASPKSQMSRGNNIIKCPFFLIFTLAIMLIGTSCKNNAAKDDTDNSVNSTETEEINKASENLEEDYNAWFQLQGKYVETVNLRVAEVQINESNWANQRSLVVALVENVTDKERGGFFVAEDIFFPVAALDEEIAILEDISTQIKTVTRIYNCTRRYITSYGITITFNYSSSDSKWVEIDIYSSDKKTVGINSEYLIDYINGLKDCKQTIIDFKAGKWSNK
jgi:hypothetical protein